MIEFFIWRPALRIVFMGSPAFAVPALERLITSPHEVVAVYTQPDRPAGRGRSLLAPPVKEVALRYGLPVEQPASLRTEEALDRLREYRPDIIVVCAFGQILTQAVLDIPPRQCLNIHFSLLPRHRGASPVAAAILAGDEFTGVSVQLVRVKLDTGPVLTRAAVPISNRDNTGTLAEKLSVIGADLLMEALTGWLRDEITPQPQNEAEATYFAQIKKGDGEIDWTRPAPEIWRRVRAYYPWPGSYTVWRGKQMKIIEADVLPGEDAGETGEVLALPDGDIGIATGDGILRMRRLQMEGKKIMAAAEFLRGQRGFIGSILPEG
jgi:methionyl-tRNA formyltransferase